MLGQPKATSLIAYTEKGGGGGCQAEGGPVPCPGGNRVALHGTADRFRQAPVGESRGELLLLCTRLSPAASKPLAVVSLVWGLPATPQTPLPRGEKN